MTWPCQNRYVLPWYITGSSTEYVLNASNSEEWPWFDGLVLVSTLFVVVVNVVVADRSFVTVVVVDDRLFITGERTSLLNAFTAFFFWFCVYYVTLWSAYIKGKRKRGSRMGQGACDSNSHRLSSP